MKYKEIWVMHGAMHFVFSLIISTHLHLPLVATSNRIFSCKSVNHVYFSNVK